ncbi:MAG: hypothetical protein KDB00_15510 [Planctomycetales bacterium]|nr:hypothetical protein [Planctomycetales bacterium]
MRKTFGHDVATPFNSLDCKFHFPLNQDISIVSNIAIIQHTTASDSIVNRPAEMTSLPAGRAGAGS